MSYNESIEYGEMASFYDALYQGRDYKKQIAFIKKFFPKKSKNILDIGCGTGEHLKLLSGHKLHVSGIDLSPQMVKLAAKKNKGDFKVADIRHWHARKKFDVIISLFAVFNHFKNDREFLKALINIRLMLAPGGIGIIDIHNPQKSGTKTDSIGKCSRVMKWTVHRFLGYETSEIKYQVGNKTYLVRRRFKIYRIGQIRKGVKKAGLELVGLYENFTDVPATARSKNIQIIFKAIK